MRITIMIAATGLLAFAATAKSTAKVPKEASMLTAADLDPATFLPPPPVADSVQAKAELAELLAVERARTATDVTAAKSDSETKNASIFTEAIGPGFDLAKLPQTTRLMAIVRTAEKDAANRGKDEFKRPRPWIIDADLKTCERSDEPLSSYPSGHTTMAFSMGATLAKLVPAKAQPIMARAARYGQSRIVCEQHWRSDVTAGEALGITVAERLMAKPAFAAQFAAAQTELAAAGVR
ncbi:phosphatase PAP2 family protein [Sphingomonas bacterium]|uniref:phosphatase PAP2 family protein n=1 Tax=Sphingomonas bacterium TaxID=1895847 RepID=UPI0020C5EABC|nr:phosphatase PAP2 family protein [Sphingomonas bacterium]